MTSVCILWYFRTLGGYTDDRIRRTISIYIHFEQNYGQKRYYWILVAHAPKRDLDQCVLDLLAVKEEIATPILPIAVTMSPSKLETFKPPATQVGVIACSNGKPLLSSQAPCPPFGSDQLYVRTQALAINPSDTKMMGDFITPGALFGADYSGTVVAVGSDVKGVQVGDRIGGAQHSMYAKRPDQGAFGQFNVTNGAIWLKLPPSWTTEAGATLGAGISTAGLAIRALGLPLPDAPLKTPTRILVYGGSTATGTIGIQLLRL